VKNEMLSLDDGIAALKAGELVVYPTETFYGVGADPFSDRAMNLLFAAKAREADKPVGLIAADREMAFSVVAEISEWAERLANAFWPGPLTLVLPVQPGFAPELVGPDGIGVRVSPHPIARALARGLGKPITATSANLSGGAAATKLAEARAAFGDKVKVYLEGGKLSAAAPSTVVAVDGNVVKMIRIGAISASQIADALDDRVSN
jgi:L-threonylcarbamoyladenylate synthase